MTLTIHRSFRSAVIALAFSGACASACGGTPPPEAPRPEPSAEPEPKVAEETPKPEPRADETSAPAEAEPGAEPTPELKGDRHGKAW